MSTHTSKTVNKIITSSPRHFSFLKTSRIIRKYAENWYRTNYEQVEQSSSWVKWSVILLGRLQGSLISPNPRWAVVDKLLSLFLHSAAALINTCLKYIASRVKSVTCNSATLTLWGSLARDWDWQPSTENNLDGATTEPVNLDCKMTVRHVIISSCLIPSRLH